MGTSLPRMFLTCLLPQHSQITTLDFLILGSVKSLFSSLYQLLIHEKIVEFHVSNTWEAKQIENLHNRNDSFLYC